MFLLLNFQHNLILEDPGEIEELFQDVLVHPDPSRNLWVDQACHGFIPDDKCRKEKRRMTDELFSKSARIFEENPGRYHELLCRGQNFQVSFLKTKFSRILHFRLYFVPELCS